MPLTIAHHNINSINNKILELTAYLEEFRPDIMTLNESRKPKRKTIQTTKDTYLISTPINNKDKGVAILHKSTITIAELPEAEITQDSKNLQHCIKIQKHNNNRRLQHKTRKHRTHTKLQMGKNTIRNNRSTQHDTTKRHSTNTLKHKHT